MRIPLVVRLLVGLPLVALLVSLLPEAIFGQTRVFLLAAASLILLFVAVALFLVPARRALDRVFALGLRPQEGTFGLPPEDELRTTFRPLVVAGFCVGVVVLAQLLR